MKIAIDIDEVLVPFTDPFLKFNGISCEGHEEEKNIIEIIEKDPKKGYERLQKFHRSKAGKSIPPLKDSQQAIATLNSKHELIAITSRADNLKEETEGWVKEHFPNQITKLYFSNKEKTKAQICEELQINVLIEDQLRYAFEASKKKIQVILFDADKKYWWNQIEELPKNIHRVHSWKAVINKIEELNAKI
jgi:uncharacterized HAD superfamily protein